MTDPVNPPLVINLPPAPLVTDSPEQFDEKAFPFAESLDPWGQSLNALGDSVKTNAESAHKSAIDAEDSASKADAALSYSNMKGEWSGLSGPISPPATVYHDGQVWALLRELPDVAASEPGVSDDWAPAFTVTDKVIAMMNAVALSF